MSITNDFKQNLQSNGISVVDRRGNALGGNFHDRSLSGIEYAVAHWTATANSHITNHETYWRNSLGWGRGGYTGWIANDGTLHLNYDFEMRTWNVGGRNTTTIGFSYEGTWSNPMTDAQKRTLNAIYTFIINDNRIPKVNGTSRILGHNEFAGHTSNSCPGINMNMFRAQIIGGSSNVSTPPTSSWGASREDLQDAKFTPTVAIKVRNGASTQATHTGTLQKGDSIIYDSVYVGNGYNWLSYIANSGNRLYVPYRESGNANLDSQWGTFTTSDKEEQGEKEVDHVEESEKVYKVQTGAYSSKDNADKQAEKLKDDGYDVYIAEEDK